MATVGGVVERGFVVLFKIVAALIVLGVLCTLGCMALSNAQDYQDAAPEVMQHAIAEFVLSVIIMVATVGMAFGVIAMAFKVVISIIFSG